VQALRYMGLEGGKPLVGTRSTWSSSEAHPLAVSDLRSAASLLKGRQGEPEAARDGSARIASGEGAARAEGLPINLPRCRLRLREPGCFDVLAITAINCSPGGASTASPPAIAISKAGRQKGGRNVSGQPADARAHRGRRPW